MFRLTYREKLLVIGILIMVLIGTAVKAYRNAQAYEVLVRANHNTVI